MNIIKKHLRIIYGRLGLVLALVITAAHAQGAELMQAGQVPFGTFNGVDYVTYSGRFVGTTRMGDFDVPYEITAPANTRHANRVVVVEPPHFLLRLPGRDATLGQEFLFDRRYSHATVGFSNQGFNMLDPFSGKVTVAGFTVSPDVFPYPRDVEIIKQFAQAMKTNATARANLGPVRKLYAFGISQSAEALYELAYGVGAEDLFDLTVLHVPLWRPAFARPDTLAILPETFEPLHNIGKVMLVSAEGDLLISQSEQLRRASGNANYRLYEVAGAPHLFQDLVFDGVRTNPLDLSPVTRAAFVTGNRWVRFGRRPPDNRILRQAAEGTTDPIYMFETGIDRDQNGNARGGVRFPDVNNGRALHIASLLDVEVIEDFPGLIGAWFDLACAPKPGSTSGQPRFTSHHAYVKSVWKQAFKLVWLGYLLPLDALDMIRTARDSDVGKPGSC